MAQARSKWQHINFRPRSIPGCIRTMRGEGARQDRLAKCESEQARAKQHKAGCGYCEESIGHEVMIAHGTPAARVLVSVSIVPPARTERYATQRSQKDFALLRKLESD